MGICVQLEALSLGGRRSVLQYECKEVGIYGHRGRFIDRCGTCLTTAYIFLLVSEENSTVEREKSGVKVLEE